MRNLEKELKNRTIDNRKLQKYGFIDNIYKAKILQNQFEIIVEVNNNTMTSRILDTESNEEYILVDIEESTGEFVGNVRKNYEEVLNNIIEKCTYKEVFKEKQSKEVIEYIKKKYNDELEFLWERFDNNAIWRNKHNNKWYGLLLTIKDNKLGLKSDKIIEIIDLRYQKDDIHKVIDNKNIFPGYHMNKRSWITIILNNSIETKKIFDLVDNSYNISINNK